MSSLPAIPFALRANLELLQTRYVSCHLTDVARKKHVDGFQLINRGQRYHKLSGADLLYIFSTSTIFETGKTSFKFATYAILEEHGGDFSATAHVLTVREGTKDDTAGGSDAME